ncbi:hypothetical protein HMPREF3223_01014 [Cutibacterium avidum]|nr:hypothetical protein HMPREF3223_01014 [Cutibacterium avidum]
MNRVSVHVSDRAPRRRHQVNALNSGAFRRCLWRSVCDNAIGGE